jgi:hypothetical protein
MGVALMAMNDPIGLTVFVMVGFPLWLALMRVLWKGLWR